MSFLLVLISAYLFVPMVLGCVAHKKAFPWKYTFRFWRGWKAVDYIGCLLLILLVVQFVLVVAMSRHSLNVLMAQAAVLLVAIWFDEKIKGFICGNIKIIGWVASVAGLMVSYLSSIFVDATITGITSVKASELPIAQSLLKLMFVSFSIVVIFGVIVSVSLALYTAKSIVSMVKEKARYFFHVDDFNKSDGVPLYSVSRLSYDSIVISNLLILAVNFYPWQNIKPAFDTFKEVSVQMIALTFNVHGASCGVTSEANPRIAILSDKLFIMALKDSQSKYRFVVSECVRSQVTKIHSNS